MHVQESMIVEHHADSVSGLRAVLILGLVSSSCPTKLACRQTETQKVRQTAVLSQKPHL